MKLSECTVGLLVEDKDGQIGRICADMSYLKHNPTEVYVKVAYPTEVALEADWETIHPYKFHNPAELNRYEE